MLISIEKNEGNLQRYGMADWVYWACKLKK